MVWLGLGWATAFGQDLPAGAVLRSTDVRAVEATSLAVSIDGTRVLVFGPQRAVLVGPDGGSVAEVERDGIWLADVAASGRFALAHDGGVTIHGDGGREQLRLATFGRAVDLALSADGRYLAVASTLALTVNDVVDGRTLWSSDGATAAVAWDAKGGLWADREGVVTSFNPSNGKPLGAGPLPGPGSLLADGCLGPAAGDLCPAGINVPAVGVTRPDGTLWVLVGGKLQRWTPIGGDQVSAIGTDGGTAIVDLAWMGSADLLVARLDGRVERRGPDGTVVADVAIPDCTGCTPLALGGSPEGGFWVLGPTGGFMAWDASGAEALKGPKSTTAIAARQLADGRWVSLGADGRARIGSAPGKGKATRPVPGARGVDAAGETVAVWSDAGLWTYDLQGRSLAAPSLGPGRKPVSVELSDDGSRVAVIDDGGALHLYQTADGRSVFRNTAGLGGSALGWSPAGDVVYAGGAPLRLFSAADGTETARVVLAPSGIVEHLAVAADGTVAVVQTVHAAGPDAGTQLSRRIARGVGALAAVEPSLPPAELTTPSDVAP